MLLSVGDPGQESEEIFEVASDQGFGHHEAPRPRFCESSALGSKRFLFDTVLPPKTIVLS